MTSRPAGSHFPKSARLRVSEEFRKVSATGRKSVRPCFLLLARGQRQENAKIGLTVSRKVGNAVARNRVKRIIREYFRLNLSRFPSSLQFVVIARPRAGRTANGPLRQDLEKLFLPYAKPL